MATAATSHDNVNTDNNNNSNGGSNKIANNTQGQQPIPP